MTKQNVRNRGLKPLVFCVFGAVLIFRLFLFFLPYPELDSFLSRRVSTRVLDKNGELLQVLSLSGGLRREFTAKSDIPPKIVNVFIRAEDRRFYFHFGIDFFSVFRAFFQNASKNERVSGASTITMQLARMVSPSSSRSFGAKIRDCVNAVRIEGKLSKSKILELYLNNVPFGKNAEGITSAARTFYGKSLSEISEIEAASLAVIPRNPRFYNPLDNPQQNANAAFRITKNVSFEEIFETVKKAHKFEYPFECPHYIRFLEKSGAFLGKIEVKTSILLPLQKFVEARTQSALNTASKSRIANAAVCVRSVKTGEVLAWSGSGGWSGNDGQQIDGVLNPMQPGSSMKPFLYALALDSGFSPNDVIADVPSEFGAEHLYIPHNFNNRFNGPVRFRVALASSLNIPAVKILEKVGEEAYLKKLFDLGFDSLKNGEGTRAGLSIALGGGEVRLFELVGAFAIFARDGVFFDGNRVFSSDSARIIADILSDKNARATGFGYAQTFETEYPAIFKTGTANQYQNITALGSTREYSVGVWMGNFSGNTVVGKTGSSLPALTAREILDFLSEDSEKDSFDFPKPEGFEKKYVCALSGLSPSQNCPGRVFEFVKKGEKIDDCFWHTSNGIVYPAEYQRWLLTSFSSGEIDHGSSPLEIVSPRNGGIFYLDESKRGVNQIVRLEAAGGSGEVAEIIVDGNRVSEIVRPFVFDVPAVRGFHEAIVKSGGEETSVFFEVR